MESTASSAGAPRTRGDGPLPATLPYRAASCSPHPRGWSLSVTPEAYNLPVLPAPAGMVLIKRRPLSAATCAPRTRGDGPGRGLEGGSGEVCSPLLRGWSRRSGCQPSPCPVLPAPAGMVPVQTGSAGTSTRAPRTRGDGPPARSARPPSRRCSPHPRGWSRDGGRSDFSRDVLPAPAGMVPGAWPSSAAPAAQRRRHRGTAG